MRYRIKIAQAITIYGGIEDVHFLEDDHGDVMELAKFEDKIDYLQSRGIQVNSRSDYPPPISAIRQLEAKERRLEQAERERQEAEERKRRFESMVEKCIRDPELPEPYFPPTTDMTKQLLNTLTQENSPILLVGKAGVGKNLLANYLAEELDFKVLDITDQMEQCWFHNRDYFLTKVFEKASDIQCLILARNFHRYSGTARHEFNTAFKKFGNLRIPMVITSHRLITLSDVDELQNA